MAAEEWVTVTYTRAEATAAGAAMKSVLQVAVNSGAIPPRPLANAALKLALGEAEQHPELGVDPAMVKASSIAAIAEGHFRG